MLIRCPNCSFEREIDAAKIPPTAVMATCPRCDTRFRFRHADGTAPVETPASARSAPIPGKETHAASPATPKTGGIGGTGAPDAGPPRAAREKRHGGALFPISDEHPDDDPLPPGAMTIRSPDTSSDQRAEEDRRGGPAETETPHDRATKATPQDERKTRAVSGAKERPEKSVPEGMDIPWERPGRFNPVTALYQTIIRVMFSAPRFFAGVGDARGRLGRPLAFYLLLGGFQTLMECLWLRMSLGAQAPSVTDPQMQEMLGSFLQKSLPLALLLSPVLFALQLVVLAGVFFLMVRLVQPDRTAFATLFRVVAYSAAPTVLCVVPFVGPRVSTLWFMVSCLIGTRYALDLPWSRVLLALGPLYAIALSVQLQIVRQLFGS